MTVKCKHPETTFVDGKRTCTACGSAVVRIGDAVAPKDLAPHAWQTAHPKNDVWGSRGGPPVGDSADLDRILALPRRDPILPGTATSEAVMELVQDRLSLGKRAFCDCRKIDPVIPDCITRLLPIQAWMLHEISTAAGLIGAVPVGGGKELVGLLAPMMMPDCKSALLLMPASLIDQVAVNWKLACEHFIVPKLIVLAPGGDKVYDKGPGVRADAPILRVMAYTRLSSVKSSAWISEIRPDTIIANECDSLKSLESARTMRVMRYFAEHHTTRFCGWTGSLTDSSISEFAHLCLLALRERSPMPMSREAVDEWGRCLDAVPVPSPAGELIRLCEPGESVREGFRRRLSETEGFVMVGGEQVIAGSGEGGRVHLEIHERDPGPLPDVIALAMRIVREQNKRPDTLGGGEWDVSGYGRSEFDKDIEDPLEKARLLKEISSGMFYRWVFPNGEPEDLIRSWFGFRAIYVSMSREVQLRGDVHLDSPKLVENACRRGWGDLPEDPRLPSLRLDGWPEWRDIMDKVKPKSVAVRLHPYVVDDAAAWAAEQPGIVWYMMQEFADWMAERHKIPVFGGGMGEQIMRETGNRSILASMKAHGRGRDRLQYAFHRQILPQVPSANSIHEQLYGRLHRRGQTAEKVMTWVYLNTPELRNGYDQALRRAQYVEETTGAQQKLTIGWRD